MGQATREVRAQVEQARERLADDVQALAYRANSSAKATGPPAPAKVPPTYLVGPDDRNGFVAGITTDFACIFSFQKMNSRGDPIDFATGAALCDPL